MMARAPSARTKSSGFPLGTKGKFMFSTKSTLTNWELSPKSIMQVVGMSSFTTHNNVRGSSNPKSPDTDTDTHTDTGADTGADTDTDVDTDAGTDTNEMLTA